MWRSMMCFILLWMVSVRCVLADDSAHDVMRNTWRVALIDRFYPSVNHTTDNSSHHRVLHGLLDLDNDELPEPYQVSHSLNAMHNGGFFGQGIGLGSIKLGFLSEVHTDFVLAGITEEIGLIGLGLITITMILIVLRIFKISGRVENKIYHLFTIGIGLMIIIAFLINSYGVSGMIPIKGIAVPLLSYGGSSMLSMSIAIGLVLSISKSVDMNKKVR